ALQDGVDGGNGVFVYGSGGVFPTQSYRSANYFVDVVFSTNAPVSTSPSSSTSIYSASTAPSSFSSGAIELGTKFQSDVSGTVLGVAFYKAPGDTSVHTGSLWSANGNLLATGTFSGETSSGWQQLSFSSPVAVTAQTTYVVSYHTNGSFAYQYSTFQNQGI